MKLLCLHGYGTSAVIFQEQLASILDELGRDNQYVFLDGEIEVDQSVYSRSFSRPYLAYYPSTMADSVQKAHELVSAAIEDEDEPFDGILGFSQGAALAISYLMHHRINKPGVALPFQFAVLFSSYACVSPDPKYKEKEIVSFITKLTPADLHDMHTKIINQRDYGNAEHLQGFESLSPEERNLASVLMNHLGNALDTRVALGITDSKDVWDGRLADDITISEFPRFFHPVYTAERLTIPTVHISGVNDSKTLAKVGAVNRELCSGGNLEMIQHDGYHDIPRRTQEVERIVSAIKRAAYFASVA